MRTKSDSITDLTMYKNKTFIFVVLGLFSIGLSANAKSSHSLIFRRDTITIRQPESFVIFTTDENNQPIKPEKRGNPVSFSVEVRGEETFRQQSISSLGRLKNDTGTMLVLNYPLDIPLLYQPIRNPLDVLFVNKHGMILQLMPNIVLEELQEEIRTGKEVKAMLYLSGGICETNGIRPGHIVEHPIFKPKPTVIN